MNEIHVVQVLGIAYTAIAFAIMFNPQYYRKMLLEYVKILPLMFINALLAILIGYVLLNFNSIWGTPQSGFVTFIGWVVLLKGLFILLFPKAHIVATSSLKIRYLTMEAFVALVLGVVLLYIGFVG